MGRIFFVSTVVILGLRISCSVVGRGMGSVDEIGFAGLWNMLGLDGV